MGMVLLIQRRDSQTEHKRIVTEIEVLEDACEDFKIEERVAGERVGMGGIWTGAAIDVDAAQ